MTKCVNCGKEHPHYVQDFLVVSRSNDGFGGMTTTTERLCGAERHAVCRVCLFKRVTKRSLLVAVCVVVAVFFGSGMLFGDDMYSRIGPFIFIAAALGCAAGIAFELIILFSRKLRAALLGDCASAHTSSPLKDKLYVPVGDGLYESEQAFKKVNSRFATDIGARLYSELIATGHWKDYVAAAVSLADGQAAPIQTVEIPEGEHKALMSECVQELLRLYRQTPGGFLTNSAAAQPVRAIGKKLDAAGGFELMLQAHGVFAASNPGMGLARNLEMIWDGIGGWRG